jgi:hypothetical protein
MRLEDETLFQCDCEAWSPLAVTAVI